MFERNSVAPKKDLKSMSSQERYTREPQPFDSVLIFAGPGGIAFGVTTIENLKKALESHGKTVVVVGDGQRDLKIEDITTARSILKMEQNLNKKFQLMIYTHGHIDSYGGHILKFSDSLDCPSSRFIEELLYDYTGCPMDIVTFSCHGGALLNELKLSKTKIGYAVALSPGNEVVSGLVVDAFVRKIMDIGNRGISVQMTQDLLILYLAVLSIRTPPQVLTDDKKLISLSEHITININDEEEVTKLASCFFNRSIVEKTIKKIRDHSNLPAELCPCAYFLYAVTHHAVRLNETSPLLELINPPKQEDFFKSYLSSEQLLNMDDSMVLAHLVPRQLIQLGAVPPENEGNTFTTYKHTEKTKRLYDATFNFTKALFAHKRDKNLILILTGTPGIGKTHLAMAALNEAQSKGVPTYYITYAAFSSASYGEKKRLEKTMKENPGLLVLDDCNRGNYDRDFNEFIKTIHEKSRTSILMTSNESLGGIRNNFPFGEHIVVCEDNEDISQRKPWWSSCDLPISVATMPSNRCCGMLIVQEKIDLNEIKKNIDFTRKIASLTPLSIRIAGNPLDRTGQRYNQEELRFTFNEGDKLDAVIIKVITDDECDQLLRIVGSAWEFNRKIIVACSNELQFQELLKSRLYFQPDKERLKARLEMFLLTPSILSELPKEKMTSKQSTGVADIGLFSNKKENVEPTISIDVKSSTSPNMSNNPTIDEVD